MDNSSEKRAISFSIAKWWGYVFAAFYLLYGGVSIVLSMMDSNIRADYDTVMESILFILIGVVLVTVAIAFRDGKQWGWYGLIAINILTIASIVTRLSDPPSLVLGIVCLVATVLLFLPTTRSELPG